MQSLEKSAGGFGNVMANIMFLGMMATLSAPYLIDVGNIPSMAAIVVSAASMIAMNAVGKKHKALNEFLFPQHDCRYGGCLRGHGADA